jgi:hypothetical protein
MVSPAQRAGWRRWLPTGLVLLCLWSLVLVLFRGSEDYGMNYDEVLRLAPYMAVVHPGAVRVDQALYRLEWRGLSLPLMFKTYISSLASLPMVPALLFDRQPAGLRRVELFYFLASVTVLFVFLRRFDFALAAWTSLLVAAAPHLYPEVRFGFVTLFYQLLLVPAALLVERGIRRPTSLAPWFFSGLAFGLCVNLFFYSLWVVAGAGTALALVFPQEFWSAVRRVRRVLVFAAGCMVGGANYVVYNVATRGGSVRPLIEALFDRAAYNRSPIDYRPLPSSGALLAEKLVRLKEVFGDGGRAATAAVAVVLALAFAVLLITAHALRRRGRPWTPGRRAWLFAPTALVLIGAAIMVTPQSGRAGHWGVVSPFLELTIVGAVLFALGEWRPAVPRPGRALSASLLAGVLGLFFVASNRSVVECNATRGSGPFTATIYDVHRELAGLAPGTFEVVTVDWGFWSQLYYLSRGRLPLVELCFRLTPAAYAADRDEIGAELERLHRAGREAIFLWHDSDMLLGTGESFERFAAETGAVLDRRTFVGRRPEDRHFLGRVMNTDEVLRRWRTLRGDPAAAPAAAASRPGAPPR